jgi:hypothetical protein
MRSAATNEAVNAIPPIAPLLSGGTAGDIDVSDAAPDEEMGATSDVGAVCDDSWGVREELLKICGHFVNEPFPLELMSSVRVLLVKTLESFEVPVKHIHQVNLLEPELMYKRHIIQEELDAYHDPSTQNNEYRESKILISFRQTAS